MDAGHSIGADFVATIAGSNRQHCAERADISTERARGHEGPGQDQCQKDKAQRRAVKIEQGFEGFVVAKIVDAGPECDQAESGQQDVFQLV